MEIGLIGLGQMGSGMAANLLKAGHQVTVYNRTRGKADELGRQGARVAERPADACRGEIVITMLADDHAVEAVVLGDGGVRAALARGGIHVSMSTISVALSERLHTEHEKSGQVYVAAPVFGRPDAAAAGKLFIVAAGARDAIARCQSIFDTLGQRSFIVADAPPAANLVKLSGNFLIASVIESLGEAIALIRKAGIDPSIYIDILTGTLFSAPIYKTYGALIVEEKYQPAGFKVPLGLKDVRLALAAAEANNVPMPLASMIRDHFLTIMAQGDEALDWSSLARLAAKTRGSDSVRPVVGPGRAPAERTAQA